MASSSPMKNKKEMSTVTNLDIGRYIGWWYEITCFPSTFQPHDDMGARTTYTLIVPQDPVGPIDDTGSTVRVVNETWSGGKRSYIEGTMFKATDYAEKEARLKVRLGRKKEEECE